MQERENVRGEECTHKKEILVLIDVSPSGSNLQHNEAVQTQSPGDPALWRAAPTVEQKAASEVMTGYQLYHYTAGNLHTAGTRTLFQAGLGLRDSPVSSSQVLG